MSWRVASAPLPIQRRGPSYIRRRLWAPSALSIAASDSRVLVAGADQATTPEQATEFKQRLTQAGVPFEQHIYKDAPHSFFDRSFGQWKEACDDAWRRMLEFVKKHS